MSDSTEPSEQSPEIEFWFEFGSNYSYLSVMRIEDEARRRNVRIAWKPFLLGPIFRALGFDNSPFVLQKEKGAYVWQDMARQCRKYGLRWTQPSKFPRLGVLPLRVALLGAERPWIGAFCRQVMELNWALDQVSTSLSPWRVYWRSWGFRPPIFWIRRRPSRRRSCYANKRNRRGSGEYSAHPPSSSERKCSGATIAWTTLFHLRRRARDI